MTQAAWTQTKSWGLAENVGTTKIYFYVRNECFLGSKTKNLG